MGVLPKQYFALPDIPEMTQIDLEVTPLHTRYTFLQDGIQLHVTFSKPLFPDDNEKEAIGDADRHPICGPAGGSVSYS